MIMTGRPRGGDVVSPRARDGAHLENWAPLLDPEHVPLGSIVVRVECSKHLEGCHDTLVLCSLLCSTGKGDEVDRGQEAYTSDRRKRGQHDVHSQLGDIADAANEKIDQ